MQAEKKCDVLIIYLGSRGGGVLDTFHIAEGLSNSRELKYSVLLSENNPLKEEFVKLPLKGVYVVKTHRLSFQSFLLNTFLFVRIFKILRVIFKSRPNAILFTMDHPWFIPILFFVRFLGLKIKIIYIRHNPLRYESVSSELYNKILEWIGKILLKDSDVIFTFSKSVKEDIVDKLKLPEDKIHNFRFGLYTVFCRDFHHKGFFKNGVLRILFFGRILQYKGIDILVDAYTKMREEMLPVDLTIAGEGDIDDSLKNRIKVLDITLINRWISDDGLCSLLENTDIVIIPYKEASQSGPASIATSLGIPIIATEVGGLVDQVLDGVNGYIVKPNSPDAIIGAIKKIIENPNLLEELAAGAIKLKKCELSWSNTCQKMDKVIQGVLL